MSKTGMGTAGTLDVSHLFAQGVALHRQNQLAQAMAVYERVLRAAPEHAGAMHHVGILAAQAGNHTMAAGFLRSALKLAPHVAAIHLDLGNACKELGRFEEALESYGRAGELDAALPDLHFNRGATLQALARFDEALAAYDLALAASPRDAECHNNRGVVLKELGRFADALDSLEEALALNPRYAAALNNRGNVYREMGQFDVALMCYEHVIALGGGADAHFNRATALQGLGARYSAVESFGRAIELKPAFAAAHVERALALEKLNRFDAALADCRAALALAPDSAKAHAAHGVVLFAVRRTHEALAAFKEALRLEPDNPDTWDKCGVAHRNARQFDEALACHDKAMALGGERIGSILNKGNVLRDRGQHEEAIAAYRHTLEIAPHFADAYVNLGTVYDGIGRRAESRASYDRAIELDPEFALAHWNRSLLDLQDGNFADGWRGYEWRWKTASLGVYKEKREFAEPRWTGAQDLAGKTILLWGEQGFGDVLQFCRYATMVAARGATVILEVKAPLCELMRGVEGVRQVVARGEPLPPFDYQCPLLSLPLAFGTDADSVPAPARYLRADPDKVRAWEAQLGARTLPRIGIVWSGNPFHVNDRNRSMDVDVFARLFDLPAQFVSLQKEVRPADRAALDARPAVLQAGAGFADFGDTAAVCELLDMVISVDTSVAHLAAGLGKPTWILLPHNSDWRWLRERSDNPWYPTVRLYRGAVGAAWDAVLDRVRHDLENEPMFQTVGEHA